MIETDDLLEQFLKEVRERHPQYKAYSDKQLEQACRLFFAFVRDCIRRPDLPRIRILYFGLFRVKPGKALGVLRAHEKGLKSPNVQMPELIQERIEMLTNYLKKYAPHKLIPKQDKSKGESQPQEHTGLDSGELEVPSVLLTALPDKTPDENPHPGTDPFPDFLHGLSML